MSSNLPKLTTKSASRYVEQFRPIKTGELTEVIGVHGDSAPGRSTRLSLYNNSIARDIVRGFTADAFDKNDGYILDPQRPTGAFGKRSGIVQGGSCYWYNFQPIAASDEPPSQHSFRDPGPNEGALIDDWRIMLLFFSLHTITTYLDNNTPSNIPSFPYLHTTKSLPMIISSIIPLKMQEEIGRTTRHQREGQLGGLDGAEVQAPVAFTQGRPFPPATKKRSKPAG